MIYIKCANYQHFESLINDYISGGWTGSDLHGKTAVFYYGSVQLKFED